MDLMGLIVLLRAPLEFVAFILALYPLMSVLFAWPSFPKRIPTHFGAYGRPDRFGSRAWVWFLPVLALVVYGFMSQASGTWEWVFGTRMDFPAGAEISLLLKPGIGLLMSYATQTLIRVARKQEDALNGWLLSGLMLLLIASPLALSVVAH
jgi:hypothetical protein